MSKFKVGDRLVWLTGPHKGRTITLTVSHSFDAFDYIFDDCGDRSINSTKLLEEMCVDYHLYQSPLYQALL